MTRQRPVGAAEKRAELEASGKPWPTCECHSEPLGWHRNDRRPSGGSWRCPVPSRERARRWADLHREEKREKDRRERREHPERVRARQRRHYAAQQVRMIGAPAAPPWAAAFAGLRESLRLWEAR